ncbi:hypothetical protein AB0N88_26065 [Streptomyces sp. NPDC093516]|uniref:hypothetical protein n=1 Tax=unclassified Streptomyces TaxID=2593676 RepID=UPI003426534E
MRSLKSLAVAVSSFALATTGVIAGAGSAGATYSACIDTVAANGGLATASIVENACQDGVAKRFDKCESALQVTSDPVGRGYGPGLSEAKAQLACKRAAVLPAP